VNKEKAFQKALEILKKEKDGINIIEYKPDFSIKALSTGILGLDLATKIGGYPRGRIVEMFGPESGGKSTVSLVSIAKIQQLGGNAVLIDAENSFDPKWAKKLGIDINKLKVIQCDSGEDGLDAVDVCARSNAVDLIVVDSTAALTPKSIIEGDMEDQHIGKLARMMSQGMMKLCNSISRSETVVIFINQLRENIGIMWGDPETTPGGRALKFYSSMRIKVFKIKSNINKKEGHRINVRIVKNKVGPPFGEAYFDLYYKGEIDDISGLFEMALNNKIIKKEEKTYFFRDIKCIGQEKFKKLINDDKKICDDILEALKKQI